MPVNSEELCVRRSRSECNTMLMLAAKFRNKTWFQDLSTKTFQRYVDFLLGEKIFQLQIPKGDGSAQTMAANPSWDLVINFEHKLRKEAYRRTSREGRPLAVTMEEVMADATLKETFFVTPLKEKENHAKDDWEQTPKQALSTPQHRMGVRFAILTAARSRGNCGRVHVCQFCLSPKHNRHGDGHRTSRGPRA